MPKSKTGRKGPRTGGLRGVLDAVTGARMCFGEPITTGNRTVVPVARVRAIGGGGWGGNRSDSGGGGGGTIEGTPVGFIELGDDGARYHQIQDPDQLGRNLRTLAGAAATLVTTVAGARALRRGAARALPRRSSGGPVRRALGR